MIDKMMLKNAIDNIERERAIHDEKFAGNPVHKDCLPRFDKVLANLKADLAAATQSDSASDKAE